MNRGEMRTHVMRKIEENTSSPVYWSAAEVNTAINEGYEEISDATEWYERSASLTRFILTYLDLRVHLTDTFLSPRRAFNNQTNRWLEPVSVRELDNTRRRWETETGEPRNIFQRGLFWMGRFPRPASTTGTDTFYYTAIPALFTADTDEPGFPEEFHWGIVDYAVYDLFSQEGETDKAMMYWASYKEHEIALRDFVDSRQDMDRTGRFFSN